MKSVFVIDPGMMEAGGHHAALLSTLIATESIVDTEITIFGHMALDKLLAQQAIDHGITVKCHFSSNFYEHYSDGIELKISGIQSYIRQLAGEYYQAIQKILLHIGDNPAVCFYPCLNWEHANALSLALKLIGSDNLHISHKVCCMFMPSKANETIARLYYQMAFGQLGNIPRVTLFASDSETLDYYQRLNLAIVGVHPCYLLPWQNFAIQPKKHNTFPQLLLYMGDAKVDKGFLLLPSLVEDLLQAYDFQISLTIQYTLAWEYPALTEAICELNALAKKYHQLKLINEFLPTPQLIEMLNSVDTIVCTYEPSVYQTKSSGLAWLACFCNIPVVVREDCWLTREFTRLQHSFTVDASLTKFTIQTPTAKRETDYFNCLFNELLVWLQQ
jgi:hypothetical protein